MNPDQLASTKPADQDLHCFQNIFKTGFSMVNFNPYRKKTINFRLFYVIYEANEIQSTFFITTMFVPSYL